MVYVCAFCLGTYISWARNVMIVALSPALIKYIYTVYIFSKPFIIFIPILHLSISIPGLAHYCPNVVIIDMPPRHMTDEIYRVLSEGIDKVTEVDHVPTLSDCVLTLFHGRPIHDAPNHLSRTFIWM